MINNESIFKKRLIAAKDNSQKVKLMFQYPGSPRAIKKSGKILDVADDGFTINEIIDGEITYSYNFLVEVSDISDELFNENYKEKIKEEAVEAVIEDLNNPNIVKLKVVTKKINEKQNNKGGSEYGEQQGRRNGEDTTTFSNTHTNY